MTEFRPDTVDKILSEIKPEVLRWISNSTQRTGSAGAIAEHDHSAYVRRDGTTAMLADWDAGVYSIQSDNLQADFGLGIGVGPSASIMLNILQVDQGGDNIGINISEDDASNNLKYGIRINTFDNAQTFAYGLYINDFSVIDVGGSAYAIYTNSGDVRFGDDVNIVGGDFTLTKDSGSILLEPESDASSGTQLIDAPRTTYRTRWWDGAASQDLDFLWLATVSDNTGTTPPAAHLELNIEGNTRFRFAYNTNQDQKDPQFQMFSHLWPAAQNWSHQGWDGDVYDHILSSPGFDAVYVISQNDGGQTAGFRTQGNVLIGDATKSYPSNERLEIVGGGILLDAALGTNNGTIQWTGSDLEGRVGGAWVSLTAGGTGGVSASGTPADNQLAVWVNASSIEGESGLTWDGTTFTVNANDADVDFHVGYSGASGTPGLFVEGSSGRVAVGTASPDSNTLFHSNGNIRLTTSSDTDLAIIASSQKAGSIHTGGVGMFFQYDDSGIFGIRAGTRADIESQTFSGVNKNQLKVEPDGEFGLGGTMDSNSGSYGDAAIYGNASGQIGIATDSPDRLLHAEVSDAVTSAVTYAARLSHVTSGTAAADFGTGLEFELEGADGTNLVAGAIESIWTDASTGAEDADLVFKTAVGGAVATEVARFTSAGVVQAQKFYADTEGIGIGTAPITDTSLAVVFDNAVGAGTVYGARAANSGGQGNANHYGFWADLSTAGADFAYAFYAENVSAVTAAYAIYTNNGLVRIGDSTSILADLYVDSYLSIAEQAAPGTPPTGEFYIYPKTDGKLYGKDDGGTEYDLTDTGGDVSKVGTPADNQVGVWTGDGTIEGDSNLIWDGNELFIGDSSNTGMTQGLTINQGANDDEIFALKSSDVAHGVTSFTETDTYFYIAKASAAEGGASQVALSDGGNFSWLAIGIVQNALGDTTKTSSALAPVVLQAEKRDTLTGVEAMAANENLVVFRNYTNAVAVLDADGDLLINGSLMHLGDTDTYLSFGTDRQDFYAGNVQMLTLLEAASDQVIVNEAGADVDFRVESNDSQAAFYVAGDGGGIAIGTSSYGGTAGQYALAIVNGTAPLALSDAIQLYSIDLSAGNTILGLRTEGSGILSAGSVSADGTMAIEINGTTYYLLYSTTAAA